MKNSSKYIENGLNQKYLSQCNCIYDELISSSFTQHNVLKNLLTQPINSEMRNLNEGWYKRIIV